jgi:hypothetical protein
VIAVRQAARAARGALALGCAVGLMAVGLPSASATAALSTSVVSASTAGPNAAMTEGDVAAGCTGGLLSGGGARVDQSVLSNGTHLVGSFPTPDGAAQSAMATAARRRGSRPAASVARRPAA